MSVVELNPLSSVFDLCGSDWLFMTARRSAETITRPCFDTRGHRRTARRRCECAAISAVELAMAQGEDDLLLENAPAVGRPTATRTEL
jgi:hypothetical protein